jgi:hypothetical protein
MKKMNLKYFYLLLFFLNQATSASHTNLQSHYCHNIEEALACDVSCINYYQRRELTEVEKNSSLQNFYRFRYNDIKKILVEQRASMPKSSNELPSNSSYEDYVDVDYCSQFNFIDDDNWICINDYFEDSDSRFLLGMKNGSFYLINEEGFNKIENVTWRNNNPDKFMQNGSVYLECMKSMGNSVDIN